MNIPEKVRNILYQEIPRIIFFNVSYMIFSADFG